MANTPNLLDPIQIGDLHLPNRVLMAPLTRLRGTVDHVPTPIIAEYYAQRATAGLIVTEGVAISPEGFGWADTPGLWTAEQNLGITEGDVRKCGKLLMFEGET